MTEEIHSQAERPEVPEHMRPDSYDRTLQGYLELLQNLQLTQRALNADFRQDLLSNPDQLRELAQKHIDEINAQRAEQLDINHVDPKFLAGLVQPNWSEHFPPLGASKEDEEAWETFKSQFDSTMQINLEGMRELHAKAEQLNDDAELQVEFHERKGKRLDLLRLVATKRVANRKKEKISKEIAEIRLNAGSTGRKLTPAEIKAIERMSAEIAKNGPLDQTWQQLLDSEEKSSEMANLLAKAEFADGKRQMEQGLLMTRQMKEIIHEALPAASRGEPLLFVGETGGAKTALAEYFSRAYFDEPELVSGYADANSYQMMGKQELRAEGSEGATESVFVPGPVLRAMEEGRPLIMDEMNAMDPGLLKRFNKILQLRPGHRFTVQEDSGREVIVKPGFFVIGTMNEKSKRYKSVDDLSVEYQNRFGANVFRVRYPDHDVPYGELPAENVRLVYGAICDKTGELPAELDPEDLFMFVKASYVSQQVFTGAHGEGVKEFIPNDKKIDNEPGLEETVLAPRTMVAIIQKVARSYGEITLDMALRRFVDGVKNENDKNVLRHILTSHGFLKEEEKPQPSSPFDTEEQ